MAESQATHVTQLLRCANHGDSHAAIDLLPLVYEELRSLARARMAGERPGDTLQATALVHEAYLRLVGDGDLRWADRGHFFAAAAQAMRRILIDRAREAGSQKRGGGRGRVPLSVVDLAAVNNSEEILALDEAISRLELQNPEIAAVVRLRFYAGLSVDESAKALGISPRSVDRAWTYARAWLFEQLQPADH